MDIPKSTYDGLILNELFNTGRDLDLVVVKQYLNNIRHSDDMKLFDLYLEMEMTKAIVLKDLPIGISATINKLAEFNS